MYRSVDRYRKHLQIVRIVILLSGRQYCQKRLLGCTHTSVSRFFGFSPFVRCVRLIEQGIKLVPVVGFLHKDSALPAEKQCCLIVYIQL